MDWITLTQMKYHNPLTAKIYDEISDCFTYSVNLDENVEIDRKRTKELEPIFLANSLRKIIKICKNTLKFIEEA